MLNSPKEADVTLKANTNRIQADAESSPLSPFKKGRNEYNIGGGETNFTTKSMEKKKEAVPFTGFTMKNTIDMNTSGAAVTSKPIVSKKEEKVADLVPANPILPKIVVIEKA